MVSSWLRSPRIRRGLAASAIVLSAGGLVLFRADHGSAMTTLPILTSPVLAASPTRAPFSGPGAHGSFALSHARVLAGGDTALYGEVRISADKRDDRERAPLSIAVVLDTSGSMDGEKIEDAKNSVVRLIRDMRDDDEIALVRYSDEAELVQSLARVGTVRDDLVRRVRNLGAGGGTAIPRGLKEGMSALEGAGKGRVKRVVLVSDGLDSTRVEAERLASQSAEKGVTVSSLGIGLDFDAPYMSGVAQIGHGNFGFVKDSGSLATFLQRELHETATTTVENARVRIKPPSNVRFERASGADVKDLGDGEYELRLGSLFAGDERRVLVEMTARVDPGAAKDFAANAEWQVVGGPTVHAPVAQLSIVGSPSATEVDQSRDPEVMASAISVLASRRQLAATEAYQRGDVRAAEEMIDKNLDDLKKARDLAPPSMRPSLDRQFGSYDGTKKTFVNAAPTSAAGNAAAKGAMEKDVSNTGRAAF